MVLRRKIVHDIIQSYCLLHRIVLLLVVGHSVHSGDAIFLGFNGQLGCRRAIVLSRYTFLCLCLHG